MRSNKHLFEVTELQFEGTETEMVSQLQGEGKEFLLEKEGK